MSAQQFNTRKMSRTAYGPFHSLIDSIKAFDSVERNGLWKIPAKLGCPINIVNIIRVFDEGMMASVIETGCSLKVFESTME